MKEKIFYKNPRIDHLFGTFGHVIPTKQDAFKPIDAIFTDVKGKQEVLKNIYVRKPNKQAIEKFNSLMHGFAKGQFPDGPIPNSELVEVILSISVNVKRFKEVDVDNLAKCVLDSLKGVAFEDDSQVSSLICSKHIHPDKTDGIFIGITKVGEGRGFGNDIFLFSQEPWE